MEIEKEYFEAIGEMGEILIDEEVIKFISNRLINLISEDDTSVLQYAGLIKAFTRKLLIKISEHVPKIMEENIENIVGESVLALMKGDN